MRDTELFKARAKETETEKEALDAFFRGNLQTALTRAENLIIDNDRAILSTFYSKEFYSRIFEISPILNFTEKYYGPENMSIPIPDYEAEGEAPTFKSVILKGHLMSSGPVPIG